jgi:hypothetical protein
VTADWQVGSQTIISINITQVSVAHVFATQATVSSLRPVFSASEHKQPKLAELSLVVARIFSAPPVAGAAKQSLGCISEGC